LEQGTSVQAAYTFGSPRVGDPAFAGAYPATHFRVENRLDIVPHVPLAELPSGLFPAYQSVGTLEYLSDGGLSDTSPGDLEVFEHALGSPGLFDVLAFVTSGNGLDQLLEELLPAGIRDHLPQSYFDAIQGLLGNS